MNVTKTNPVGIDIPLQKLQTLLHGKLITAWDLSGTPMDYQCYGRCYRNKTDNGYVAEYFTGIENKYQEVYFDSQYKAISFFGIGQEMTEDKGFLKGDVHLVFFVDLAKLKPAIDHRADEEVRKDVIAAIGGNNYGFNFTGIELSLENVLQEYPGSRRDDRLKYIDMHPIHCFRINFDFLIDKNNCY